MKQSEIYSRIESIIPGDLWIKYNHLSFGEMAEIDDLSEWRDELEQAEEDWFLSDDA